MAPSFPVSERTRLRRRPQRGAYDEATVFGILDAGVIAHVGYTHNGEPRVTPTVYWREGRRLYWHGAAASQALCAQATGLPVCVTVTQLDGFVLGRSGFAHSVNYRSVMAFGRTEPVEGHDAKRRAMDAFIERLYPGRTAEIRKVHDVELDMIQVIAMPIDEASAKIREGSVNEKEEDLDAPGWAGVVRVETRVGAKQHDARIDARVPVPASLAGWTERAPLGAVLANRKEADSSRPTRSEAKPSEGR